MANYTQYIPQVNSTTYPTSINNCFTALTTDVTALETNVTTLQNGKLNLSGGNLTGALVIDAGGLTLTIGSLILSSGNILVSGTVDGRDVATDGTKLDTIETSATADQTGAEIKTAYETEADTNAFTDANVTSVGTIASKAPLASPTFTGTPSLPTGTTAITQTAADNSTKLATTAYADAAIPPFKGCLVFLDASQAITVSTYTSIAFDQETYDTDSIHDNVTNNTRLTIPSGVTRVRLTAQLQWTDIASGSSICQIHLRKNGVITYDGYSENRGFTTDLSGFGTTLLFTSPVIIVTSSDYFELFAWHNYISGLSAIGSASGSGTWFSMEIIE